jgi:hypothetical protein
MKHLNIGLLIGGLLLLTPAPALAATVDVQIEGQGKVMAPTRVVTPASVTKDGTNSCPGNTSIGALEAATNGNWSGSYGYGTYTAETILGEEHRFGSGSYWTIYKNNHFQNTGACQIEVADGDEVLFFWSDDPFVSGTGGYDDPVVLKAPTTAKPGEAFTVSVDDSVTTFDANYAGTTTFTPSAGANVNGATTGADGRATVTLTERGPQMLVATKGNRAPDRTQVCVSDGADGFCGTTQAAPPVAPCRTTGDDGFCGSPDKRAAYGKLTSVSEGKRFKRGQGPRELKGLIEADGSGIQDVRVRLTGRHGESCTTYDGKRERLVGMKRCGATRGMWFSVGDRQEWTYLLPRKLGPGRYVLDLQVIDRTGNRSTLARGTSRVVFHVG